MNNYSQHLWEAFVSGAQRIEAQYLHTDEFPDCTRSEYISCRLQSPPIRITNSTPPTLLF